MQVQFTTRKHNTDLQPKKLLKQSQNTEKKKKTRKRKTREQKLILNPIREKKNKREY